MAKRETQRGGGPLLALAGQHLAAALAADVYAVTRGRNKGRRGRCRDILIAMGVTPAAMFRGAGNAA